MARDDVNVAVAYSEVARDERAHRSVRLVIYRRRGRTNEQPTCPLAADFVPVGTWNHTNLDLERVVAGIDRTSVRDPIGRRSVRGGDGAR